MIRNMIMIIRQHTLLIIYINIDRNIDWGSYLTVKFRCVISLYLGQNNYGRKLTADFFST